MDVYDVIVVGSGPAGMTAAIYTCRKQLKTLVLGREIGGQTNQTAHIENYPGVDPMPGAELMQKFKENMDNAGAEFDVANVTKVERNADDTFRIHLDDERTFTGKTVILAFGREPRKLHVPGEDKFFGRGIATCVTCDALLFKNKTVAVVGGGNAALDGALELTKIAKKVYMIHRFDFFEGDESTVNKVKNSPLIQIFYETGITEVKGERSVKSVTLKNLKTGATSELALDGFFLEIGSVVNTDCVAHLVKRDKHNQVIVDANCGTGVPGLYACGDVVAHKYKQTVIAAGQGAVAALEAHFYLTGGKLATY
jgi:alkyl hydroperoxide reductase subunit F